MTESPTTSPPRFIVSQRYSVYNDISEQYCQGCAKSPASHTIQVFEDMPSAIRLDIGGEKSKTIRDYLFKNALAEQEQGKFIIYATIHTCPSCTDIVLQEASGNPRVSPAFFAALSQSIDVTLVLGRYSNKLRIKPTVALTAIQDISEFVKELNEQDTKAGKKSFMKYGAGHKKYHH